MKHEVTRPLAPAHAVEGMAHDNPGHDVLVGALFPILPPVTRALFWRLRYEGFSSWLHHAPLAFWLVESCRPGRIAALGLGDGTAYFALCQAVDKLGLPTRCTGIDAWADAPGRPGTETRARIAAYNAAQYREFSALIDGEPAAQAAAFTEGSIDLLQVDFELTPAVTETLMRDWSPKLSRRAVVLLHGVPAEAPGASATEGDLTARAFAERIRARHPSILFEAGSGLLVALIGPDQPEKLRRLAALPPGSAERGAAGEVFERLGQSHYYEAFGRRESAARAEAETSRTESNAALAEANAQLAAKEEEIATHCAALEARGRVAAEAQARLFDAKTALAEARAAFRHVDTREVEFEELCAVLQSSLAERDRALEVREAEAAAQAESIAARFVEIAQLTGLLDEARRAAEIERERACEMEKALAEARREAKGLADYGRTLEKRYTGLLGSPTWRATAPARRLARLITRRPPPKPFALRLTGQPSSPVPAGLPPKGRDRPSESSTGSRLLDPNLYINKVNDILHSRSGGMREYVPFDIVKTAERAQAASDEARFVFAIPLASAECVADWAHTKALLEQTLRSLIGQSDPDWTAIIAGHERPDVPALNDPRIEFVSIHRPRPRDKGKFRADKAAKRHVLGRRLAEMGGGYFMQLDADDLVRDDLVATVRSGYPAGAVSARGYALDYANRRLAPVPGAWRQELHNVCGSCSAVYYRPEDLPSAADKNNDQSLVFNMTRQHAYTAVVMEELGRPLETFEEPMVVYLVNHGQSLSFSLQKAGSRGANIVEAVARHALPLEEARAVLARFGLAGWP